MSQLAHGRSTFAMISANCVAGRDRGERLPVLCSEGVIDHPAIPTSSLLKQPERKPGAIHQPHFTVDCRVFKER
jgi:hypothetical protein